MLRSSDEAKVRELAAACDIVTIEIEHVDAAMLQRLEQEKVLTCVPSPSTILLIQDKFLQKQHLSARGIPVPAFLEVLDESSLSTVAEAFGFPYMLKSKTGAYDGNGNFVVSSAERAAEGFAKLGGTSNGGLYAERWCPFKRELAVMVVKSSDPSLGPSTYPVVETTQKDNICHTVVAPGRVSVEVAARAREVAAKAVSSFQGGGIFGVEMFELEDGSVLLNEIAPRPHNSGHYTMEACAVDQFENHLRAVLGLPLGSGEMSVPAAVMVNILGEDTLEDTKKPLVQALYDGGGGIHWYGKAAARKGRKMAHVTLVGQDMESVTKRADALGTGIKLGSCAPLVGIIMGSDSDLPTMKAAADVLLDFGVSFEMTVVSAHRTPERMYEYAKGAESRGLKVIIAGAGGAAHLPGMVAALTALPVIGVPVKSSTMSGLDSLYSIVQMPRGIPVATVAIGNAMNAGLLAVRMLSIADASLLAKMNQFNASQRETVLSKAENMESSLAACVDDRAMYDAKVKELFPN